MEWGREEEREFSKLGIRDVATSVRLRNGQKGRIICVRADAGGKVGSKVCPLTASSSFKHILITPPQIATLLETIAIHLSSPTLTPDILHASKLYLFLLPSSTNSTRETIIGCVIAQRITTAMAVVPATEVRTSSIEGKLTTASFVSVDPDLGLFCFPVPLPTIMGIPRLFVPSTHRRNGVATSLLNAAASTFIHGCTLDPKDGDIAFTQPTSAGRSVMESWGKGGIRIYQE